MQNELVRSIANNVLHLVLMPTEACNFRCSYCYEDFSLARMEPGVIRGVQALLSRRAPGLDLLELSWFGGEPLLALEVIEAVSRHVRNLQADHPRLRCTSDITTNGYLLSRPRFARLLECGIRTFQIPIDGPRAHHDQQRLLANGRGTFHRIWKNLLGMRRSTTDFRAVLRLHVDPVNAVSLPNFIARLATLLDRDPRFPLFIRPVSRLGGPRDGSLAFFGREDGREIVGRLRRYTMDQGIPVHHADASHAVCYAARGNSYVVRADGRLNKCTVALENLHNQVGRIDANGTVDVDATKMQHWMRGLWSGRSAELECPLRGAADPESDPVAAASDAARPVRGFESSGIELLDLDRITAGL